MSNTARRMFERIAARYRREAGSLRTQLIVGNVAALTVLLAVLGIACRYMMYSFIMQSVDRELDRSVHMFRLPPPGPDGRFAGPRPGSDFMPPMNDGRFGPRPGPDGSGYHAGGPGPEPFERDSPYRPRQFDSEGRPIHSNGDSEPWDPAGLAQALHGDTVRNSLVINGERLRVLSTPGFTPQRGHGVVQSAYPLKDVDRVLGSIDSGLLLLIPIGLAGAAILGATLTSRVLVRVARLTNAAAAMGAQDLSRRLPAAGDDEFSGLARTFNGLLGRLDTAFRKQERLLDEQRRFTADASHELKTPLTIIKGGAGYALAREGLDPASRETFGDIAGAADTMSRLVQDLLFLARGDEGRMGRDAIDLLALEVLERARTQARCESGVAVRVQVDPTDLTLHGNEAELVRLFRNLLDNAIRYSPPGGTVTVEARRDTGGSRARIVIADEGHGLTPEQLSHLGERFYRADESRTRPTGGSGLGLSICKSIVEAHGGSIDFESAPGDGLRVIVRV